MLQVKRREEGGGGGAGAGVSKRNAESNSKQKGIFSRAETHSTPFQSGSFSYNIACRKLAYHLPLRFSATYSSMAVSFDNRVWLTRHGRLRLDKKSIIRQYRNLQRAKTKSNIVSHYTVHVLRTTNHTYFETFSKK